MAPGFKLLVKTGMGLSSQSCKLVLARCGQKETEGQEGDSLGSKQYRPHAFKVFTIQLSVETTGIYREVWPCWPYFN